MSTELLVWIKWLRNYQNFEGKFSVPIAHELERVLQNVYNRLLDMQAEIEILKQNGGANDGRKDAV